MNSDVNSEMARRRPKFTAVTLLAIHAEPHCHGDVNSLPLRLVQRSQIVVPVTIPHRGEPHLTDLYFLGL